MAKTIAVDAPLGVRFRPALFGTAWTGALDIGLTERRILSIPTQLGCAVGCTFCVSRNTPVARNLSAEEMLSLVAECLNQRPADGRPIELSFTGEGEALLNARETGLVCRRAGSLCQDIDAVRYCFSGLGSPKLLRKLDPGPFSARLQFSLHAARQSVRDRLVPNSVPLVDILDTLQSDEIRTIFPRIELNVVLQDGVNDSDEDLKALSTWGEPSWPILLNALLMNGQEVVAERTDHFAEQLRSAGRSVGHFSQIAREISRGGFYPGLSFRNGTPLLQSV